MCAVSFSCDCRNSNEKQQYTKHVLLGRERGRERAAMDAGFSRTRSVTNLLFEGHFGRCIQLCERYIEEEPETVLFWKIKGECYNMLKQHKDANALFDRAIARGIDSTDIWYEKAKALEGMHEFQQAVMCYDQVLAQSNQHAVYWCDKGRACRQLGWAEEALTCFDRAINIIPDFHIYWNEKGRALHQFGRLEEALECFNRTLSLINANFPFTVSACYVSKGNVLVELNRVDEAKECYDRALDADSGCKEAIEKRELFRQTNDNEQL